MRIREGKIARVKKACVRWGGGEGAGAVVGVESANKRK